MEPPENAHDLMKVAAMQELSFTVISPDKQHLNEILCQLKAVAGTSEIYTIEGNATSIATLSSKNLPGILIYESQGDAGLELAALKSFGTRYPSMSCIVLREQQLSDFLLQAMRTGIREVLPLPLCKDSLSGAIERTRQYLGISSVKMEKFWHLFHAKAVVELLF